MTVYVDSIRMVTHECCTCHCIYSMSDDLNDYYLKNHDETFYCPRGHGQVFAGKTEEQKLKERVEQEQQRASSAEQRALKISKNYSRMRKRVSNGVCPCCNRTFDNLGRHMQSQHPDFSDNKKLKTLRVLFGLSQGALEEEIGVNVAYISNYENGKRVPEWAQDNIQSWVNAQ